MGFAAHRLLTAVPLAAAKRAQPLPCQDRPLKFNPWPIHDCTDTCSVMGVDGSDGVTHVPGSWETVTSREFVEELPNSVLPSSAVVISPVHGFSMRKVTLRVARLMGLSGSLTVRTAVDPEDSTEPTGSVSSGGAVPLMSRLTVLELTPSLFVA